MTMYQQAKNGIALHLAWGALGYCLGWQHW